MKTRIKKWMCNGEYVYVPQRKVLCFWLNIGLLPWYSERGAEHMIDIYLKDCKQK